MASLFAHQLQPFEENQSPSPIEELSTNPFDLQYARSRSPPPRGSGSPPALDRSTSLYRQLSGDPESPPPAWKRRSSVSTAQTSGSGGIAGRPKSIVSVNTTRVSRSTSDAASTSPIQSRGGPPLSRRHPSLIMTSARVMPSDLYVHESSPNQSSADLQGMDLGLPQPAFRRRANGTSSNRSSMSSQDLAGLTSEEIWALESGNGGILDMSNPGRLASERPLDTVRRLSKTLVQQPSWHGGLPTDVIWPAAPPVEEIFVAPVKSKSFTNVPALGRKSSKMAGQAGKRQSSMDIAAMNIAAQQQQKIYQQSKTAPTSPINFTRPESMLQSSAHSSETSLSSGIALNKSQMSLANRPPSAYYSRDFLSSLAPREGGYAVAAMLGTGLGAQANINSEEKRRSVHERSNTRAPMAKSAGMGRWSLDGGEHYANRPSNLNGPPINSPDHSPPADETASFGSSLPEGASPPAGSTASSVMQRLDTNPDTLNPASQSPAGSSAVSTTPITRSPLGQSVDNGSAQLPTPAIPAPPTTAISTAQPSLSSKKSKKELKKAAKAAEKAEAIKIAREKAEAARQATLKKQQEKQAEAAAKAEAKRKEKEEKSKRKAEKSKPTPAIIPSAISSMSRRSSHTAAITPTVSTTVASTPSIPPVPTVPAGHSVPAGAAAAGHRRATESQVVAPPAESSKIPSKIAIPEQAAGPRSAPVFSGPPSSASTKSKKMGFLGTFKKRFSHRGSESSTSATPVMRVSAPTPPPKSPVKPSSGEAAAPAKPDTPQTSSSSLPRQAIMTPPGAMPAMIPGASPASIPVTTPPFEHPEPPVVIRNDSPARVHPVRSSSYQHSSTPPPVTLAKTVSNDTPNKPISSSDSTRRSHRNSIHGPRPMPNRTRSPSVASHQSLNGVSLPTTGSSPYQSNQDRPPVGGLSVDSNASNLTQIQSHTTSTISDLPSPFTNENSRKSSMTSADIATNSDLGQHQKPFFQDHEAGSKDAPAREGSNDTIHGNPAVPPVVSAH